MLREGEWSRLFKEEFALFIAFKWLVLACRYRCCWGRRLLLCLGPLKEAQRSGKFCRLENTFAPFGTFFSFHGRILKVADSNSRSESVVEAFPHTREGSTFILLCQSYSCCNHISTGGLLTGRVRVAQIGPAVSYVFATVRFNDKIEKTGCCGVLLVWVQFLELL